MCVHNDSKVNDGGGDDDDGGGGDEDGGNDDDGGCGCGVDNGSDGSSDDETHPKYFLFRSLMVLV